MGWTGQCLCCCRLATTEPRAQLTLGGLCGRGGELPELLGLCEHPGAGRSLQRGSSRFRREVSLGGRCYTNPGLGRLPSGAYSPSAWPQCARCAPAATFYVRAPGSVRPVLLCNAKQFTANQEGQSAFDSPRQVWRSCWVGAQHERAPLFPWPPGAIPGMLTSSLANDIDLTDPKAIDRSCKVDQSFGQREEALVFSRGLRIV